MGENGFSNMDYILSTKLPTIKKDTVVSTSDHFFLVRQFDISRCYRSEIRISKEKLDRIMRKSAPSFGVKDIRLKRYMKTKKTLTT